MGEKKVVGRKRHIAVDTQGNLLVAVVHSADVSDRDGCWDVLDGLKQRCPTVRMIWVDGGYTGIEEAIARDYGITLSVVSKAPDQHTFVVLPRRWVVERSLAWLNRSRILAKEYTHHETASESWIYLSSIHRMVKKLAPSPEQATRYEHRSILRPIHDG